MLVEVWASELRVFVQSWDPGRRTLGEILTLVNFPRSYRPTSTHSAFQSEERTHPHEAGRAQEQRSAASPVLSEGSALRRSSFCAPLRGAPGAHRERERGPRRHRSAAGCPAGTEPTRPDLKGMIVFSSFSSLFFSLLPLHFPFPFFPPFPFLSFFSLFLFSFPSSPFPSLPFPPLSTKICPSQRQNLSLISASSLWAVRRLKHV